MGMRHADGGPVVPRRRATSAGGTLRAGRPGSATSPRTAPARPAARGPLWANRILGHQTAAARRQRAGWLDRGRRPRATPSGSSPSTTSARRASTFRPPRSPAATSRSSIVGRELSRRPGAAHRRRTRRAGWTSARRPAIWESIREARAARPRRAADQRGPRRADRAVRLDRGDPARAAGGDCRPATVTPEELGAAMTGAGDASPVPTTPARLIALPLRPHQRTASARLEGGCAVTSVAHRPAAARARGAVRRAAVRRRAADQRRQPADRTDVMITQVGEGTTAVDIVNSAAVYYLAALAVAIGFQMKLFNIGVEGQYRLAACVAAIVGGAVALPPVLHTVVIILVAALARRGLGRDRRRPQGHPRGQRGHLDDHAELRGHRSDRLPDQHRQLRRAARQQHLAPSRCRRPAGCPAFRSAASGTLFGLIFLAALAGRRLLVPAQPHALRLRSRAPGGRPPRRRPAG